jgi:hypothetical protein
VLKVHRREIKRLSKAKIKKIKQLYPGELEGGGEQNLNVVEGGSGRSYGNSCR